MEALITGATGFVGSWVAEYFAKKNYNVRCTVRKSSNLRWVANKGYRIVVSDFDTPDGLKEAIEGVDIVVHVAGTIAAKDYNGYLKGNRDSTYNLLKACELFNPNINKFLYVSSLTAVGPAKSLSDPVDENTECSPITQYGKSKLEGEKEVLNFKDIFPVTIVRLPAVYGPRDTALVDMFKIVYKGIAPIIGFNDKYLSLLHSDDVAEGIFLAATSNDSSGEIFFISSEEYYSWENLIDCMKKVIGKKAIKVRIPETLAYISGFFSEFIGNLTGKTPVFNLEKAKDFVQKYWVCSPKKAMEILGFRQKIKPEVGFKQTFEWYLQNGWIK